MNPFTFRFYDPLATTSGYRRKLPHLEQPNVCYFITMTAKDAFPAKAKEKWLRQRKIWCMHNGLSPNADRKHIAEKLSAKDYRRFNRFASGAYQKILDSGSGECVLQNPDLARIVSHAFEYYDQKRVVLADYVIMPNHIHALLQPNPDCSLKETLRSLRQYTSREINKVLGQSGPYWAGEPFDHMVRSRHHFRRYQQYIRANPERAKLGEGMYILRTWEP